MNPIQWVAAQAIFEALVGGSGEQRRHAGRTAESPPAVAMQMVLTGEEVPVERLYALGLVNEVTESARPS